MMSFGWMAFPRGRGWRVAPLILCALVLAGCDVKFGKPTSVFDDEPAVATALSAIRSNYRGPVLALKVVIADDGLVLQAQSPKFPSEVSEWRMIREYRNHFDLEPLSYYWDRVSGPHPVDRVRISGTDPRLFDLDEINLADWGKLADAAIARAALEDKGGVSTIEIARPDVMVPGTPGGPVRWAIEVRSPREWARIFANAKGEIVRANLNGTIRMRGFNMYQRPELAAEAAAEVRQQAADAPILYKVSFSSDAIAFETNQKDGSYPIAGMKANAVFNWSYNGLQRSTGSIDTRSHFSDRELPFSVGEVDWALLPKIVADARSTLATPNGRVTRIEVTKPTDSIGLPAPMWRIDIEDGKESGFYVSDTKGAVKRVSLPPSKRKPIAWLDLDVMAKAMAHIAGEFGSGGRIVKIFIEKDGGKIIAQDPRKPGELMEALLRDDGLGRWGKPMFESGKPFPARELDAFTADRLTALLERTRKELGMPDAAIRDITISRNGIGMSDRDKVAVALVVRTPRGRLGRVVQALDGTLGEVYEWKFAR
jgi:hypothetical protein